MMIRTVIMAAVAIVMMLMMVAAGVRIICQSLGNEGLCRRIGRTLNTGKELDPCDSQRHLGTHTNTAADQSIHFSRFQESG